MKKIKHIKELPDWFDLGKYQKAKELDLPGWLINLINRKDMSPKFSRFGRHDSPFAFCMTDKDRRKYLWDDPIQIPQEKVRYNYQSDDFEEDEFAISLHKGLAYSFYLDLPNKQQEKIKKDFLATEYLTTFPENWAGVPRNIDDSYWFYENSIEPHISDEEQEIIYEEFYEDFHNESLKYLTSDEFKGTHHEPFIAFATVNLEASNSEIIESFKRWLEETKGKLKIYDRKRNYSEKDSKHWVDAAVLPYLDLAIWAEQENLKIPNIIMGEAIYGLAKELQSDEDAVRRTTIPIAHELMRSGIDLLRAQLQGPEM